MRLSFYALVLFALVGTPVPAQRSMPEQPTLTAPGPRCVLPVPAPGQASEARTGHASRPLSAEAVAALLARPRTATFEVTYDGFPDEARVAFAYAVAIWERHVASDVPIRIDAAWANLGDGLLGSAGPRLLSYAGRAPTGLEPNTWYAYALADAVVGEDIEPGSDDYDISATFNSGFDRWHFDTATPAPGNRFDFATVVLHELGHGLGFIGTGDVISRGGLEDVGAIGQAGDSGIFPYAYDLFVEDDGGASLLDADLYPAESAELLEVLTGEQLFFGGEQARAAYRNRRPPLHAPRNFLAGSSYSHLDERAFSRGDVDALMTPFLTAGERFETPGAVTCGILSDMGWSLGPGCGAVAPQPELMVTKVVLYPNPAAGGDGGCVGITTGGSGMVRIDVYDLLGRRVAGGASSESAAGVGTVDARACAAFAVPPEDINPDSNPERFNVVIGVDAPRAPGVYLVRIHGEAFDETRQWTVVR